MADWHTLSMEQTLRTLGTDAERGLDDEQARRSLREQGPNELVEWASKSPWRMLLAQFTLAGGALCNDALLKSDAQEGCFHTLSDPTEGALLDDNFATIVSSVEEGRVI